MNEGHAAFLILELLDEELGAASRRKVRAADVEEVRRKCVFTTHTPVPAGHDKFPMDMVRRVIGPHRIWQLRKDLCDRSGALNMTYLALRFSHYINGVSKRHGQTSQKMFPSYQIDAITNGVHAATWVAPPFRRLLDRHIPDWRRDNLSLRYALSLSDKEIWGAHGKCKSKLVKHIAKHCGVKLDPDAFTIGFARRATAYKRAALVFRSLDRLKKIAANAGAFQLVFAGKAHPKDQQGKELIRQIFRAREELGSTVPVVYIPNYDMDLAATLIPGVDLWLNTPEPPHEASGTSGMKAALNAVPSLSVLDGWWAEGCVENLTGWAIRSPRTRRKGSQSRSTAADARALYNQLENTVIPMFYRHRQRYVQIMRAALALNGSYFNTQRMVREYALKAYF
jgi:starch phosphorylase